MSTHIRLLNIILLLVLVVIHQGCGSSNEPNGTHAQGSAEDLRIDTDSDSGVGSEDELISVENRFVVLSPALGVMLQDLGFEDSIVGRHSYDMSLSRSIPVVGTHLDLDYELLIDVDPTAIYIERTNAGIPDLLVDLSVKNGWMIHEYELKTLDDIAHTLDDLFLKLVGFTEPEKTKDSMFQFDVDPTKKFEIDLPSARLAGSWSPIGVAAKRAGRTLVLAGFDPPGAMGPGSFHAQLIERLGLMPALTQGGMWQELDFEDLIKLAPESILIFQPDSAVSQSDDPNGGIGEPEMMSWEEIEKKIGSLAELPIPAVEHRRVAIIIHPLGLLPSSSFGGVAQEVRDVVMSWDE